VATLSECSAQGLPKEFPKDLPSSFIACVTGLEAHGKLRYLSSSMAISDLPTEDSCNEMTKCGYTPSMLAVFRDSARQ
jgi:hypothetical protein